MSRSTSRLPQLLAATVFALPLFAGTIATETRVGLVTGAIKGARLMGDADAALGQRMPAKPADAPQPSSSADESPSAVPAEAAKPAVAKPVPDAVELAALYYYAAQKQDARVTAEAERLRLKYPDFELPRDLYATHDQKVVDEAPLWKLYEKDDFAGAEAAIARMATENPGWQPSEDFTVKLKRRKVRITLTGAYQGKDWVGMIAAASGIDPRKERDADLLWMLIDAYREAAMKDALVDAYKGILFRPASERLPDAVLVTTLQKATKDFEPGDVRAAMAALWTNPAEVAALRPLTDDFIRADIADFNTRSERQDPLADKDVQRLRDLVAARNAPADMSLLGWYFLKLKQPKEAEAYFSKAMALKTTPEFTKGLYLSLSGQKRSEEAYALAAAHLKELNDDPQFLMNALSLRFAAPELGPIDPATVEAYSNTILRTKSGDHAEVLAWYAYNSQQFQAAEAWFVQAWNWEEEPNRLKGIALSFLREGKKKQFAALRARFGDLYPDMWAEITSARPPLRQQGAIAAVASPAGGSQQILYVLPQQAAQPVAQLQPPQAAQPVVYASATAAPAAAVASAPQVIYASAVPETAPAAEMPPEPAPHNVSVPKGNRSGYMAAFKAKRYSACVEELNRAAASGPIGADAELIRGWCYLGLNRVADARAAFGNALSGKGQVRRDAAYGSALAALRVKLTDDAEALITSYPLDPARDREVRAEIDWQRARSAFDHKDWQGALDALNARMKLVPEPADLSTMRAWAHVKLGHKTEARAIFEKLNSQIADPALMQGLAALDETQR